MGRLQSPLKDGQVECEITLRNGQKQLVITEPIIVCAAQVHTSSYTRAIKVCLDKNSCIWLEAPGTPMDRVILGRLYCHDDDDDGEIDDAIITEAQTCCTAPSLECFYCGGVTGVRIGLCDFDRIPDVFRFLGERTDASFVPQEID